MKRKFYNVTGYYYSKENSKQVSEKILENLFKNVVVLKTEMREEELAIDFIAAIFGNSLNEAKRNFEELIKGHDIDNYVFFE